MTGPRTPKDLEDKANGGPEEIGEDQLGDIDGGLSLNFTQGSVVMAGGSTMAKGKIPGMDMNTVTADLSDDQLINTQGVLRRRPTR
ncbi:MAG: hypothetical protein AAGE80_09090 [Pseudomonadota bacterium]